MAVARSDPVPRRVVAGAAGRVRHGPGHVPTRARSTTIDSVREVFDPRGHVDFTTDVRVMAVAPASMGLLSRTVLDNTSRLLTAVFCWLC